MEFTNIGLASCCRRVEPLQILTPRLQLRGLSGSNWVVAPDLKGFGDSDKPFLARQYKDQVADFDLPSFFFLVHIDLPVLFFLSPLSSRELCGAGVGGGAQGVRGCVAGL